MTSPLHAFSTAIFAIATLAMAAVLVPASEARAQARPAVAYAQHLAEQLTTCDAGLQSVRLIRDDAGTALQGQVRREPGAPVAGPAPWCPALPGNTGAATNETGAASQALPLLDTTGAVIGRLALSWLPPATGTPAHAAALRDALARRILGAANLADPFPFVAGAAVDTRAQALVDGLMRDHPDTAVLALRAPAPGAADLVVLGSSFGRHGKPADADDMKVLQATQPITGLYAGGRRFGVDLALRDRQGRAWGTMNVGYALRAGDDPARLARQWLDHALALRATIETRVGDAVAQLGQPAP